MGIIREIDREQRTERIKQLQRLANHAYEEMLDEVRRRLPSIVGDITNNARWWLVSTSRANVPSANTRIPRHLSRACRCAEAEELIKTAMLEVEPNTSSVKIRDDDRDSHEQGILVTVYFDPPLT